jgi:hypothetical protein
VLVLLALFSLSSARLAVADVPAAAAVPPQVNAPATVQVAPIATAPTNPALDLRAPAPGQPQRSVFSRWWFWTAVGAAAAATVAVIVVSSRGHAPPATDLGNQEFQP